MNYILKFVSISATTGYFEVVPDHDIDFEDALILLHKSPYDSFLHRYVLNLLKDFNDRQIADLIKKAEKDGDLILQAIACELILLSGSFVKVKKFFSDAKIAEIQRNSPLINIRSAFGNNHRLHSKWIALFKENIVFHKDLPALKNLGLPLICAGECAINKSPGLSLEKIYENFSYKDAGISESAEAGGFSLEKTINTALDGLSRAGISLKQEMRHESSLSPFALLRQWEFDIRVENNRNIFSLSGSQTSYGKGLSLEKARASLTMEIVERCSAFASVHSSEIKGFKKEYPVFYGSYHDIVVKGEKAVNPDSIALEIKYNNEPLYWIKGETPCIKGNMDHIESFKQIDEFNSVCESVFVPAQAVFLFSNFDEIDLFSGLGSTGFASGNTMEQAKLSALLEIIERHQESVSPFDISRCFRLVVEDREANPHIARLLESYYSLGIDLQFQDITPEFGVPCCKCFVHGTDGTIHKGTAASLDAKKAIISAITETNYPFPNSPVSAKGPDDLIIVGFENLPNYSTSDYSFDLAILEHILISNGMHPCYIDLTRKDIGIPVVKAIIPGMEIIGDFDEFSRVHPALFQNYLKLGK